MYILKDKKPYPETDVLKWAQWFQSADRIVAKTFILDKIVVSTVFLGTDHNFGMGKPLLFETMVFEKYENFQQRYSTWEEAEEGHKAVVLAIKEDLRTTIPEDYMSGDSWEG